MEAFRIAGVEIALHEGAARALGAELARSWKGYAAQGGPPDAIVSYQSKDDFVVEQPDGRDYPGYGVQVVAPGVVELVRRDARGTIAIAGDGPIVAHFEGVDAPYSLEAVLRLVLSFALPRRGGLVLHASGVRTATRALIFTGPSGAGKSTIARLLSPLASLGDDLVALAPDAAKQFHAFATPFSGEAGPAPDGSAPLAGLYFLKKGDVHGITALNRNDVLRRLLRNVMAYAATARTADRVLVAAADLVGQVPGFLLEFAKDTGVAAVLPVT